MLDFEQTTDDLRKKKTTQVTRHQASSDSDQFDKVPLYLAIVFPDSNKQVMDMLVSSIDLLKSKFGTENKLMMSNCESLIKLGASG